MVKRTCEEEEVLEEEAQVKRVHQDEEAHAEQEQ